MYAQRPTTKNLAVYDNQILHFGFLLGLNSCDFVLKTDPDILSLDTVLSVETRAQSGFSLGIVSDLRMNSHWNLRFLPTLSFGERNIKYRINFQTKNEIREVKKKVESTFLMFPFNFKYRSARVNNYRVYLVGGPNFAFDLASQEDTDQLLKPDEALVKIRKADVMMEVGIGIDFYLEFFKFTPELKVGYGIPNLLVKDNEVYSQAISSLRSKIFMFTFYFE